MKVYVIDAETGKHRVEDTDCSLEELYRLTHCSCIDIASRKIGGQWFDIVVDDEGLLKSNPIVTAATADLRPVLVGSLIVCRHDSDGNIAGLSNADIELLEANTATISDKAHPGRVWEALINVE